MISIRNSGETSPAEGVAYAFGHSTAVVPRARERRLVHRMLYFWGARRGKRRLPSIDDLDVAGIPKCWPKCFLLSRGGSDGAWLFEHVGETLIADCGRGPVGCLPDVPPGTVLDHAIRAQPMVVAKGVPATVGGAFQRAAKVVRFRSVLLPFEGQATGNVYLFGGASSREDPYRPDEPLEEAKCFAFDRGSWVPAELSRAAGMAHDI